MEYEVTSVLPFRDKWRAEFRTLKNGAKVPYERVRKVINAETESAAWTAAKAVAKTMTIDASETMEALLDAFSRTVDSAQIAEDTKKGYAKAARRAMAYFERYPQRCERFGCADAKSYARRRIDGGAASNTVRQEISVIRMALREHGLPDPYAFVGLPPRGRGEFNRNELRRLEGVLRAIEGPMGLAAWLAYGCRLTTGEIAALHTDNAPRDENVLRIRNAVGQDGLLRRARRPRTVSVEGDVLRRLRTHVLVALRGDGYLFGTTGSHANPQVLAHKWAAIAHAAGLRLTLNDLRAAGSKKRCI